MNRSKNGVSQKISLVAWLRPPVNHHEASGVQCLQRLLSEICCLRPALRWQLHLAAANGPVFSLRLEPCSNHVGSFFVGQFWGCLGNMSTVLGVNLWIVLLFWDVLVPKSILRRFPATSSNILQSETIPKETLLPHQSGQKTKKKHLMIHMIPSKMP